VAKIRVRRCRSGPSARSAGATLHDPPAEPLHDPPGDPHYEPRNPARTQLQIRQVNPPRELPNGVAWC